MTQLLQEPPRKRLIGDLELVDEENALKYIHSGNAVTAPCAKLLGEGAEMPKRFLTKLDPEFGVAVFDGAELTVEISKEAVRMAKMAAPADLELQRRLAFQHIPQLIERDRKRKQAEEAAAAARHKKPVTPAKVQAMPQERFRPTRPQPTPPVQRTEHKPKPKSKPSVKPLPPLPPLNKPKKKKVAARVQQPTIDLESLLQIEGLGEVPTSPDYIVEFHYPGLGKQIGYYHWVQATNGILGLVHDSRHEYSSCFVPAQADPYDVVDITISHRSAPERYDSQCYGSVMRFRFGVFELLCFVIVPQTNGGPPEELGQALQPPASAADSFDERMDYDQDGRNFGG